MEGMYGMYTPQSECYELYEFFLGPKEEALKFKTFGINLENNENFPMDFKRVRLALQLGFSLEGPPVECLFANQHLTSIWCNLHSGDGRGEENAENLLDEPESG